jgi:uncharacterized protein YndB with AHSA1/START domain
MSNSERHGTDAAADTSDRGHDGAEVSVDIAADLDRVWEALVTDGGLEPWMGQGATIDPRPDGTLEVPDIVGGQFRRGLVHTVDVGDRLGFTWWPAQRPTERSDVSITLTPSEVGTRVTVVEVPVVAQRRHSDASAGPRVTASAHRSPAVDEAAVLSMAGSLRGCWSWRLAVLALASQMVRV